MKPLPHIIKIEKGYFGIPTWEPTGLEIFCVLVGFAFLAIMICSALVVGGFFALVVGVFGKLRRLRVIGRN